MYQESLVIHERFSITIVKIVWICLFMLRLHPLLENQFQYSKDFFMLFNSTLLYLRQASVEIFYAQYGIFYNWVSLLEFTIYPNKTIIASKTAQPTISNQYAKLMLKNATDKLANSLNNLKESDSSFQSILAWLALKYFSIHAQQGLK